MKIPRLVETEVGDLIRHEVTVVRRALQREQIIGSTIIDYLLVDSSNDPKAVELLRVRQFKRVNFYSDIQSLQNAHRVRRSPTDVVVLDLINSITPTGAAFRDRPKPDRETTANVMTVGGDNDCSNSWVITSDPFGRMTFMDQETIKPDGSFSLDNHPLPPVYAFREF